MKEVRARIHNYLTLTLRNLRDIIPKVIGQLLVNKTLNNMSMQILEGINKNKEVLEALNEVGPVDAARTHQTRARDSAEDALDASVGAEEAPEGRHRGGRR